MQALLISALRGSVGVAKWCLPLTFCIRQLSIYRCLKTFVSVRECNGAGSHCMGSRNEGQETKREWCVNLHARDQTERTRERVRASRRRIHERTRMHHVLALIRWGN